MDRAFGGENLSPEDGHGMSHTFSQLLYHLVFSTRNREALIHPELRQGLYAYIAGAVRHERGVLLAIGGMPDHVHLLIRLRPTVSLSGLLRAVKSNSSGWVHERSSETAHFAWQEGYGAFTVSESAADAVSQYIGQQGKYHQRRSFEEEWVGLLKKHGLDVDLVHPFGPEEDKPGF